MFPSRAIQRRGRDEGGRGFWDEFGLKGSPVLEFEESTYRLYFWKIAAGRKTSAPF